MILKFQNMVIYLRMDQLVPVQTWKYLLVIVADIQSLTVHLQCQHYQKYALTLTSTHDYNYWSIIQTGQNDNLLDIHY